VGVRAVAVAAHSDGIQLRGRLSLRVVRPDGTIRDRRDGNNIMCTAGYTSIAAALIWAGLQDQAVNIGVTTATYLTPLWGAVGSGAGTPAKSDVALFSELGRQTVGAGASTPATGSIAAEAAWLFYFPQPSVAWTVTEAGLFAGATSTSGSGTLLDHWAFSPSVSVPTTDTLILEASFGLGP
jgi:hypothetical protein